MGFTVCGPEKSLLRPLVQARGVGNLKYYIGKNICPNDGEFNFAWFMLPNVIFARDSGVVVAAYLDLKIRHRSAFVCELAIKNNAVDGRCRHGAPTAPLEKGLSLFLFADSLRSRLCRFAPICQVLKEDREPARYCGKAKNQVGFRHGDLTFRLVGARVAALAGL